MVSKRGTVVRLHNPHGSCLVLVCFFLKKLSELNAYQVVSEHLPRQLY